MKNLRQTIYLILAAGVAGVALFAFVDSSFFASLPTEAIIAAAAAVALLRFAVYDYSRRMQPLPLPVRVLRPTAPTAADACKDRRAA